MSVRLPLTVLGAAGDRSEVLLELDAEHTVDDVARALLQRGDSPLSERSGRANVVTLRPDRSPAPAGTAGLWAQGTLLDREVHALSVLRDGMVVALDASLALGTVLDEPDGVVELRVSDGPYAGTVHRLGLGRSSVGWGSQATVRLPGLPDLAALLDVGPHGVTVTPAEGVVLRLDLAVLADPATATTWLPGTPLAVGDAVLGLALPSRPDTALLPTADGGLAYNRPPRLLPPQAERRIEVPTPPGARQKGRIPILASMAPAAIGVVMAFVLHQLAFLAMALMSPVLVLSNYVGQARTDRRSHADKTKDYQEQNAAFQVQVEAARLAESAERRTASPDPAELLLTATGPRRRLWERRYDDRDSLDLRLGSADVAARIELTTAGHSSPGFTLPPVPPVPAAPVTVALRTAGILGIAGPMAHTRGLARWLVAQAATLHSPRDLGIVVLAPHSSAEDWGWLRWLPHCADDGGAAAARVGSDRESTARRVQELAAAIVERRKATEGAAFGTPQGPPPRSLLVVLDGARELRRLPGMPTILAEGPRVGIYAICLDEDVRLLPEECRTVAAWTIENPHRLKLSGAGVPALSDVLGDQVSTAWAERVGRALAPLRDVSRDDADAAIPDSARLLDVLGLADPTAEQIVDRWSHGGRSTAAVIGVSGEGPFTLDLRFDGPHGLIAGTTGAGKSELLQTIIASLAVANRPDAMTFVLIDYKGGSAFKDCARLPHTVGMVSDLDSHLTQRALTSLSAELKRREEVLLEADAKDIEDYWDARSLDPDLVPLPRLVLVIDEFASLVAELPDFVTGLVGIAQRGRSLGVHLLLATQRPAGVVSADIRANTNLRIALRVTDAAESSDVIDAPDAGLISRTTPGRCFVRSGAASLIAVQTARVGGRRSAAGSTDRPAPRALVLDWPTLGHPLPPRPVVADDATNPETDLTVLVDAIRDAAEALRIPSQHRPWLPALPELITLDELAPVPAAPGHEPPPLPIGVIDQPARQDRSVLGLDLVHGGHRLVVGSPRSGRTSVLRTIAAGVSATCSPADVHVFGIDCGGNGLLPLVAMPHCGAVVTRDQVDRLDRLVGRLAAEVSRRQQLLAVQSQSSVAEQRAGARPEDRLPWLLLLLDRWEGYLAAFEQYDSGRLVDSLLGLLREGPAVGLRAVVTSDRTGLIGQVSTIFEDRLLLRLTDAGDYGLAGVPVRDVPSSMPAGRALVPSSGGVMEAQLALLDADPSGVAQVAALQRRIAAAGHPVPPAGPQRPMRVDALPPLITEAEVDAMTPAAATGPLWARLGAGGDDLGPVGVDLSTDGPGFTVAGPPRSGRSTALLAMTRWLLRQGVPVLLLTPRRSPLRNLAVADGVLAVLTGEDGADQVAAAVVDQTRYVVVVDDAELLMDAPIASALEEVIRTARDAEHGMLVAGTSENLAGSYRGFTVDARRSRSGLILAPRAPSDGDLLGVRLPRGIEGGPPGRGILVVGGAMSPVQVAWDG